MIRHHPRPIFGLKSIRQNRRPLIDLKVGVVSGIAALLSSTAGAAYALPQMPSIVGGGAATFNTTGPDQAVSQITQTSSRVVIDWGSFNIANGENVAFNQTAGKGAIAFNVVTTPGQVTSINGGLTAPGGVWLFSPAGIIFGSTAKVSTGSFLASTGIFNSAAIAQANGGGDTIQIASQGTPAAGGAVSIDVQDGADIEANAGFVLLHSPTLTIGNADILATDAVIYTADNDVQVQFATSANGITMVDESSASGTPSDSHIDYAGSTTAGTYVEFDAAEDVTTDPGYGGVINLSGHVTANGIKADTANPDSAGDGFSVILDGDSAGNDSQTEVTTVDGSGGDITAASGIYANAGRVQTGTWTSNGGQVQLIGGGGGANDGVDIDAGLAQNGTGLVSIVGTGVDIDSDIIASGSIGMLSHEITVEPNVTIQAGRTVTGSSLIAKSTGDIDIDPSSSLFVGPALGVPTGALTLAAGATITPQDAASVNQVQLGTGGDLSVGAVSGTSVTLQATPLGGVGGKLDIESPVEASGTAYMTASQLTLGANGGVAAGLAVGTAPTGAITTYSASGDVVLQNAASPGLVPAAAGDVDLGAAVDVNTPYGSYFAINAYHAINVTGQITESGLGEVDLLTDQGGGSGNDYSFTNGGALSFTGTPDSTEALDIDGQYYTLIYNQTDLLGINNNLSGYYALATPLDFAAGNTATIFTGAPIASTTYATFYGTFTGLGNAISNLNIQEVTPVGQYSLDSIPTNGAIGLFGFVGYGGVVRDVNLPNVTISAGGGVQVGALVGDLDGQVLNSSSSGFITDGGDAAVTTGEANGAGTAPAIAGGLVGLSDGQVINSRSSADVLAGGNGPSDPFAGGSATVGGLVGMVINAGSITNSSASGIVATGDNIEGVPVAGGLVGAVSGYDAGGPSIAITGSSASGTVSGGIGSIVGGLVGQSAWGSITGSFATGAVTGGAGSQIGGFAGQVSISSITTSYATGAVTQLAGGSGGASNYAGGFVGLLNQGSTITQSYSSGAVASVGGDSISPTMAGGFAGDVQDNGTSISNAYSLSPVATTGQYADTGGFAGVVQGSASVSYVYASGAVSGSTPSTTAGLVGVLGDSTEAAPVASLSDAYWDTATTGQSSTAYNITPAATMGGAIATASAVNGISGASVYTAAAYANLFGETNTWVLVPGVTRPMLQSEYSTTITNAHQLQLMETDLSANYTLANDIDASGTSAAAGTAGGLWNPATEFSPVGGNGEAAFTGTFDGQGHTISGLTITFTAADSQSPLPSLTTDGVVGLFGFVGPTGVLENVNLTGAKITAGDGMIAGALAGGSLGLVNNASSSGTVTVGNEINTGQGITADAGGLVGATAGTISNSSSSAIVSGGDAFVGGLLGTGGDGAIVINSYATGAVSVGAYPAGGIDTPAAGGLVGEFSGSSGGPATAIAGGYASGAVSGGAGSSVGGFVGSVGDAVITDAYATGSVDPSGGGVSGSNSAAGGFVGSMEDGAQINNAYASGDVSAQAAAAGQFTRVGGFAGQIEGDGTGVYDAYALGSVTINGSGAGTSVAGGFAGAIDQDGEADHVYATGFVSNPGSPGAAGGLVGQVGSVDGGSSTGGSIFDSYWDQGTTGQTVGAVTVGAGTQFENTPIGGMTGPSPYEQSTYANFNFTPGTDWYIVPGSTRPILQSEYSTDITNAHQLQLMDMNLNTDYVLGADIDATNVDGASGLWNPATGFSPVGATVDSAFGGGIGGRLDGQGHIITNLTVIGIPTTGQTGSSGHPSDGAAGLFGFIGPSGMVQNVHLVNVNVSGGDGMEVGALAGDVAGQIVNATSSGSVTVLDDDEEFSADARAGGLVGDLTGTIQNSSSSVTVTGGDADVGGLIGKSIGGIVTGSFATGGVIGGAGSDAGGLIGYGDNFTVSYSYATGSVTQSAAGDVVTGTRAGGFAGELDSSTVNSSFASGAVSAVGSTEAPALAGGFVGNLLNTNVTDAYATGSVTASGPFDTAGGFAGYVDSTSDSSTTITNVYAIGAISAPGEEGVAEGLFGVLSDAGGGDTTVSNVYWNATTTGQLSGFSVDGEPNYSNYGDISDAPYSAGSYSGFNFSGIDGNPPVWSIPSAGYYPQLYGASHVINVTAEDTEITYGNYPAYTVTVTGLQGGDTIASAVGVGAIVIQPLDPLNDDATPTVGYSGYYNVNNNDPYNIDDPYDLSIAQTVNASGPTGVYRPVYNDNVNIFDGTLLIDPASLTVAAVTDERPYDGGTDSSGQPTVTGLVPGDVVYDDETYGAPTQSFGGYNAGGQSINVNPYTVADGNTFVPGANYTTTNLSNEGQIDPETIVIGAVTDSKVYNGTTSSGGTPVIVSGTLYNEDANDLVTGTQAFESKDVMGADNSTLYVVSYQLDLNNPGNYNVVDTGTANGTITPLGLTASLTGTVQKIYDGATNATLSAANYSVSPVLGNDQVGLNDPTSGTYDTQNVGTEKLVSVSGLELTGADAEDYSISPTLSGAVGEIDKADLTLSAVTDSKPYDGTTTSTALPGEVGLAPSDTLSLFSQNFVSKDVIVGGFSTLVVTPGYTITESDGSSALGNYNISTVNAQGTITPLALTASLTGTVTKIYDGTTDATLAPDNYSLSPVIGSDQVGLNDPAGGLYDTQNVGTGKLVTVSGLQLTGADAEDYSISPTVSGDVGEIDKADLTLYATYDSKIYDGTTTSSAVPTESGLAQTDILAQLSQSFASKNVIVDGCSTLVVNGGYTITEANGSDGSGNYDITTVDASGQITPVSITLSAVTDSRTYDGTTNSGLIPTASKLFDGDKVDATQSFASKDVLGAGESTLQINPGYTIDDGDGGADYTITNIYTAAGTITPLALTAGLMGTVQKQYDGDTTATLTSTNYSLPGVVQGDDVSLNDPTSGTYDNRNAGTGKIVSVSGLVLGGDDQEDYSLSSTTASGPIGIITQAPLTLTAVTATKTYDGTVIADVTPTNSALIEGDSISGVTEAFGSKNVMGANGSTLSVNGYTISDGNGGANYAVTLVTAPGTINAAPLTLAAVTDTKTYDGTTASSATPGETGLVSGDSITGLTETYDSKDAGPRTLSVAGYTIDDGNDGGNYIVTTTVASGTIDQKALTASLVGSVSKQYDGNTDATLAADNYSLTGVVSGDQVSLNDPTAGEYDTSAAGTHKLVSVDGLVLSGADAANYIVNGAAAAQIGTITAPAQPIVYVVPPVDLTQTDLNEVAAAAGSVVNFTTTVVNVFPVGNVNNGSNYGDNTPVTGSGNRDLWTGWDNSDNPCPPGSSPNCHTGNGGHP